MRPHRIDGRGDDLLVVLDEAAGHEVERERLGRQEDRDDELVRLAEQFVCASALDRVGPYNLLPPQAREPRAPYQVSGQDEPASRTAPVRPSTPVRPTPVTPFKVRTPLAAVSAWAGRGRTVPAAPRARH